MTGFYNYTSIKDSNLLSIPLLLSGKTVFLSGQHFTSP